MRDRLGALDGHVSIVTAPGNGTFVIGSVPLPATIEASDTCSAQVRVRVAPV